MLLICCQLKKQTNKQQKILGKIQDGGQDGDHCLWRHRPPEALPPIKYTSSC